MMRFVLAAKLVVGLGEIVEDELPPWIVALQELENEHEKCYKDGECLFRNAWHEPCCSGKVHNTMRCADGYRCGAASKLEESEFDLLPAKPNGAQSKATVDSGSYCIPDGQCAFDKIHHCCNKPHHTSRCPYGCRCGPANLEDENEVGKSGNNLMDHHTCWNLQVGNESFVV
jgi:hypothetical protein